MKTQKGRPLTFSDATIAEIRRLAADGMRTPDIGKAIGRNWKGVWQLMKRLDIPRQPHNRFPVGNKNPSWRGGKYVDNDGYIYALAQHHPYAVGRGYVREHRLIVESHLGRFLLPEEVVHHRNGNTQDNRIENLELFRRNADHLRKTLKGLTPKWTEDGMRRMRDGVLLSAKRRTIPDRCK